MSGSLRNSRSNIPSVIYFNNVLSEVQSSKRIENPTFNTEHKQNQDMVNYAQFLSFKFISIKCMEALPGRRNGGDIRHYYKQQPGQVNCRERNKG